jgi:hypothetical protein
VKCPAFLLSAFIHVELDTEVRQTQKEIDKKTGREANWLLAKSIRT